MKKVITRTLSGIVYVSIVIGAIFAGEIAYSLLFLFIAIIGMFEFYRALRNTGIPLNPILGITIGCMVYCILTLIVTWNCSVWLLLLIFPVLFFLWIFYLWKKDTLPFESISYTLCGIIYVAVPLALTQFLAKPIFIHNTQMYLPYTMLGIFVLQWTSDTFAYLTGITIGKHPLFERHSPKKSWEGFFGGFLFCVFAGFLIGYHFHTPFTPFDWIIMAAIVSIIGTLGDLIESMFKRSMGIKDSGKIMPGHGGILDRFDSLIMVTPFLLGYLLFKYLLFV